VLVWITGTSGVGKSTIGARLRELGWRAKDADWDGFSRWVDRTTGTVITDPPDPVPDGWLERYGWRVDPDAVTELANRARGDVAFLAGSVENEVDVWHHFDQIVCLVADDATIVGRVSTRSTNHFGKHPSELQAILAVNRTTESDYRALGATIIDGTAPVDTVTDEILESTGLTRGSWTDPTRRAVHAAGVSSLCVDELRRSDLDDLDWAGGRLHIDHVASELDRAARGEVEYLAVRGVNDRAVAKGGIDYHHEHAPWIWQLSTHPNLQSLGIGSHLVSALERRARAQGFGMGRLGVEIDNARAIALYERLGYREIGREDSGWDQLGPDGQPHWHATVLAIMFKTLD
jgi:ribosomal protein S18 acetylase RimI-like enzyme